MIYEMIDTVKDFCGNVWDSLGEILPSDTPTLTLAAVMSAFAVLGVCLAL
jgi:hypothetical protein